MTTSINGYRAPARILHWVVALMVIALLPIGSIMTQQGLQRSTQDLLFIMHKNGGVIVLALMVLRLAWRLAVPPTPMPASVPEWQEKASSWMHKALYFMLFFMALTGYIRVRAGGFPVEMLDAMGLPPLVPRNETLAGLAKSAHFYGRFVLLALILVHVLAALQHALIKKDEVFGRIWPLVPRG